MLTQNTPQSQAEHLSHGKTLLAELSRGGTYIPIWTNPNKRSYWPTVDDLDGVDLAQLAERHNVYFGVNPVDEIPPTNSRGEPQPPEKVRSQIDYVAATNALYAEFDAKDFDLGKAEALAYVKSLEPQPSWVNDSGGGYHAYWILEQPTFLESEEQREDAADLQRAWVDFVGGDKSAKDLARVLRVPGTVNHKYESRPMVTVVWNDGPRYTEGALRAAVDETLQALQDNRQKAAERRTEPSTPDQEELVDALRFIPERLDYSDWLAVLMGIHSAYPGEDGIAIAENWSAGYPGEVAEKFASFSSDGGVTVKTIYRMARDYGWKPLWKDVPQSKQPIDQLQQALERDAEALNAAATSAVERYVLQAASRVDDDLRKRLLYDDTGADENGELFAMVFGEQFRWNGALGYMQWTGTHWADGDGAYANFNQAVRALLRLRENLMKEEGKQVMQEAETLAESLQPGDEQGQEQAKALKEEAKSWFKRAKECRRSSGAISGVETQAKTLVTVGVEQFKPEEHLINCINGIVNLRTGELQPHDRQQYFTSVIATEYDPNATSVLWLRLLVEWMGDQGVIDYTQQAIGYSLSGSTREECMFFLQGTPDGRDGKGTFANTIARILGKPMAQSVGVDIFTGGTRNDPQGFRLAPLHTSRMIVASETEPGKRMNEEAVKRLTGRDDIACSFKGKTQFSFEPSFAIWLMSNHKNRANPDDGAYWRRLKIIPFPNSVPEERIDKTLKDQLMEEHNRQGILAWAVAGAVKWYSNPAGLAEPPAVKEEGEAQRKDNDGVGRWIDECCELIPGANADDPQSWSNRSELWDSYKEWCDENNEFTLSGRKWANYMNEQGFTIKPVKFAGMTKTIRKVFGIRTSVLI